MSTKHVILGLLDIKAMSGYDLAQNIKISIDSLWAASYGQIYPMLHKLAEEGLVYAQEQNHGLKRPRIIYHLSAHGKQELEHWIHEPVTYLPFRDPFKLWASYLDRMQPQAALRGILRHIELHEARRVYLEGIALSIRQNSHPLIRARAEQLEGESFERLKVTRALMFDELAAQAQFEIDSAKRILKLFQTLFPETDKIEGASADAPQEGGMK